MASLKRKTSGDCASFSVPLTAQKVACVGAGTDTISQGVMSTADTLTVQNNRAPEGKDTCADDINSWPSYKEIAPKVGLNYEKRGDDIPKLPLPKARLPDDIFWDLLQDLRASTHQHGLRDFQSNEEARTHYVFAHFNRLLSLFSGTLLSTPDIDLENVAGKPAWTEHRYAVDGAVTFLFIEVKSKTGFIQEQLDHFALIIARCLAIYSTNSQNDFAAPIIGVVSDGNCFQFFGLSEARALEIPKFSLLEFHDGSQKTSLAAGLSRWSSIDNDFSTQQTVIQIRDVCEALYGTLLSAFTDGVMAHQARSSDKRKSEELKRWMDAQIYACKSCEKADTAWSLWHDQDEDCEGSHKYVKKPLTCSIKVLRVLQSANTNFSLD